MNNLCSRFESSIQIDVFDENDQFEGWQLEALVDEEKIIIVAEPYESRALFDLLEVKDA